MIKFLDLPNQYRTIKNEVNSAINEVLESCSFIGGEYVKKFEAEFANFCEAKYCVGCGNGTDALEIAIEALQLPPKSDIIVPANSFIASSEAVSRTGHNVVFCDVSRSNFTLEIKDLKRKITSRTAAILVVHLYGQPCDMDEINAITEGTNIKIIEDCAQAHGAEYKGSRVGSLGDVAAFSFYPGKNLGAYGDAGAVTTNNNDIAVRARMIANHGRIDKYNHEFEGRNSRLDALQAAVLSVKLNHLEKWTERRIEIANLYRSHLEHISDVTVPKEEKYARHVYHLFVIQTNSRDKLSEFLKEEGIEVGVHYPIALPNLQAYCQLHKKEKFNYDSLEKSVLSLPVGEHLSDKEIIFVCERISKFFA
ncbi:DegT/DnrJ/EryC1/StrS family aminotransferase [Idiomarina abyssalis]|uniref:DegT/DnrJ/EryC1/StrS family aminotransferase n=1 Tax=Idiomarina abyssalis TaxID=86102 RepID=UPI001CD2E4C4|nr:DegT/DnrJ/EryC1/StrS family aminotransferase [Idiomarina abyssalis]